MANGTLIMRIIYIHWRYLFRSIPRIPGSNFCEKSIFGKEKVATSFKIFWTQKTSFKSFILHGRNYRESGSMPN